MLNLVRRYVSRKRTRGQSLVEFTIMLPVLLVMLSGLIEFGFMLNYYLDLIDAAREAARFAAGDDPLRDANGVYNEPNPDFYFRVEQTVLQSLSVGSGGQVTLTCPGDNVVISAFGVDNGVVARRFPSVNPGAPANGSCGGSCATGYKYCPASTSVSNFTTADINARLIGAPDSGLVLVEIYYDYDMILGLPWITAFVANPVRLHAYSIMPNVNVEPTPTP
jgi:hypothetical protein